MQIAEQEIAMTVSRYIVMTLLAMLAASVAAQDIQTQIEECEACHGGSGVAAGDDVPTLAGRDSDELLEALDTFYYYERHCSTTTYRHGDRPKTPLNMCNIANTLSEEDRRALADHFSSQ